MPNSIRVLTVDAAGTLIKPWPSVGAVYAKTARKYGDFGHAKIRSNLRNLKSKAKLQLPSTLRAQVLNLPTASGSGARGPCPKAVRVPSPWLWALAHVDYDNVLGHICIYVLLSVPHQFHAFLSQDHNSHYNWNGIYNRLTHTYKHQSSHNFL